MSYYNTLLSTPEGGLAAVEEKELKIGVKKVSRLRSSVYTCMIYTLLYKYIYTYVYVRVFISYEYVILPTCCCSYIMYIIYT